MQTGIISKNKNRIRAKWLRAHGITDIPVCSKCRKPYDGWTPNEHSCQELCPDGLCETCHDTYHRWTCLESIPSTLMQIVVKNGSMDAETRLGLLNRLKLINKKELTK